MSISIIVTTFNDGEYLPECLASIAAQTLPPDEIIIVDDGSTQGSSLAGIEAAIEVFPDTVLIRQANQGPSAARNRGLAAASGAFVAFVDADDRLASESLQARLNLFGQDARIVAAFGGFVAHRLDGTTQRSVFRNYWGPMDTRLLGVPGGIPGGLPLYLVRRESVVEVGGLDPSLTIMEDFDLLLRLGKRGGLFAGCNDPLYLRTLRPGSLTRASAARRYRGSLQFLRKASREGYFSRWELARRHAFALAGWWRQRVRLRSSRSE